MKDAKEGLEEAKRFLYQIVDSQTFLFLSGGSTPKPLYEMLSSERRLEPGAVGMIDERFGEPLHLNSNERMVRDTNLLLYFSRKKIPFYPILQSGKNRIETALGYEKILRDLNSSFSKRIGILGVGEDGHIAGIAPNRLDFKNPLFDATRRKMLVSEFYDAKGVFGERVTLTFQGLSLLTSLLVIIFGKKKKKALLRMLESGPIEEVPARFFLQKEIAIKTILITDQKI